MRVTRISNLKLPNERYGYTYRMTRTLEDGRQFGVEVYIWHKDARNRKYVAAMLRRARRELHQATRNPDGRPGKRHLVRVL